MSLRHRMLKRPSCKGNGPLLSYADTTRRKNASHT